MTALPFPAFDKLPCLPVQSLRDSRCFVAAMVLGFHSNKGIVLMRITWSIPSLMRELKPLYRQLVKKKRKGPVKSTWWAVGFSLAQLALALAALAQGTYHFSPMQQFPYQGEIIRMWGYLDRFMLRALLLIIKPTFAYLISPYCYHLTAGNGIKITLRHLDNALATEKFNYAMRLDIKSYYASIRHPILLAQVNQAFDDPKILNYLNAIITTAVDDGGRVFLPSQGIPRRSSLSPFFGALYLSPLDKAFAAKKGVVYLRFMDDILILFQTKRQFQKGRKTLFSILRSLKLSLSPHKSWMGKLTRGFHFP